MAIERLVENYSVSTSFIKKIPLNESNNKLLCEGKEYSSSYAFEAPVWDLSGKPNRNGRKYPRSLAEKLCSENAICVGLADHPKEEGSTKDIVFVTKDPHIRNNIFYVNVFLVGALAKTTIKDILDIPGASINLSSSGFGEVLRDGFVDVNSYTIERYVDWVLNNSEPIAYFFNENAITESLQEDSKLQETNNTINSSKQKEGKQHMSDKKTFSVEQKAARYSLTRKIKEAEEVDDLQKKLEAYEEIDSWFDDDPDIDYMDDIQESVKKKISELNEQVKEFAKKGEKTDALIESETNLKKINEELTSSLDNVNKRYDVACQMLESLREFANKMKDCYINQKAKANGMIEAQEYADALNLVEELKNNLKEADNKVKSLLNEKKSLQETLEKTKRELNEKIKFEQARLMLEKVQEEYDEEKAAEEAEKVKEAEEEAELEKAKAMEEGKIHVQENGVIEYVHDKLNEDDAYKDFADVLLGCKTLIEPQKMVLKIKPLIEGSYAKKEPKKIEESILKENANTYKFERSKSSKAVSPITSIRRDGYL